MKHQLTLPDVLDTGVTLKDYTHYLHCWGFITFFFLSLNVPYMFIPPPKPHTCLDRYLKPERFFFIPSSFMLCVLQPCMSQQAPKHHPSIHTPFQLLICPSILASIPYNPFI